VGNFATRYRGYKVGTDVALTVPKTGPEVILRGKFENELISLSVDALVKTKPSATQGQSHYIPVLFHDDEIRTPQKILLELFALIISELQGTEPTIGLVCHNKGKPTTIRLTPGLRIARNHPVRAAGLDWGEARQDVRVRIASGVLGCRGVPG
jgi:hypothetical protein